MLHCMVFCGRCSAKLNLAVADEALNRLMLKNIRMEFFFFDLQRLSQTYVLIELIFHYDVIVVFSRYRHATFAVLARARSVGKVA